MQHFRQASGMSTPAPRAADWAQLTLLGAIWGASFLSVSLALDGFSPLWVAAGRILIAALALAALALALRLPLRVSRGVWLHALGMAAFTNALPFFGIAWAQQQVASSFVGIAMAMVPLFTLLLSRVALAGERLTLPRLAGVALGLAGVVVLIGPAALAAPEAAGSLVARIVVLGTTLSYAIGSIVTRRSPPVDPVVFAALALGLAAVMLVPVALTVEGLPSLPALQPVLALAYLGLFPTAFATLLLVRLITRVGPTFLSLTNFQVPLWSVAFGTLILSEPLPPQFLAALGLILSGLAVSRWARR